MHLLPFQSVSSTWCHFTNVGMLGFRELKHIPQEEEEKGDENMGSEARQA